MTSQNLAGNPGRKSPRLIWVEIFFFVALALFGFSVITYLAAQKSADGTALQLNWLPIVPRAAEAQQVPATALFEAESARPQPEAALSPIFTPSIQAWGPDIIRWAGQFGVDPNLAATVMQIESCGYAAATSRSGAMGLFQVMPFHFTADEQPYDPDTNAYRGMAYLARGLEISGGHAGLALAGYNGGHSVINRSYTNWANETQRYFRWGSGIYREASAGWESSPTLLSWRNAAGGLCRQAEQSLGI